MRTSYQYGILNRTAINEEIKTDSVSIDNWRSKVVIIPQEIHIFNGTILQNILTDPSECLSVKKNAEINN